MNNIFCKTITFTIGEAHKLCGYFTRQSLELNKSFYNRQSSRTKSDIERTTP